MRIRIPKVSGILSAQRSGAQNPQWLDSQFLSSQCLDSPILDSQHPGHENRAGGSLPRWNAVDAVRPASHGGKTAAAIATQAGLSADAARPVRPGMPQPRPPADADEGSSQTGGSSQSDGLALRGNERWFLVYTLPKRELQAGMRLRVQGFRVYLPQYLRTTRHARQLRTCRAPLFPRYLFVILDLERDRWLCVRGTIGVSALVGDAERPMPVPQGITEALIAQADGHGLIQFGDGLQAGQKVRIATGPFADLVGTLDRLDDTGRVRLLLDMMGSEIAITLPRSGILPAA